MLIEGPLRNDVQTLKLRVEKKCSRAVLLGSWVYNIVSGIVTIEAISCRLTRFWGVSAGR